VTANKTVKVVDSIMGTGKTSWAIEYMNANPDKAFIYCTPFLSEVQRIKDSCKQPFYEPVFKDGGRKIDDFNDLIMEGKNIVLTHSTFSNATDETITYLEQGRYTLILDEVLEILTDFNSACNDNINRADMSLLMNEGFIKVDDYGKVSWVKQSYDSSKYTNVERVAKRGELFYLDGAMLVWQFPPQIFRTFSEVYLLTYLFDGSFLKPYFEYHDIHYVLQSVDKDDDGKYKLVKYRRERGSQYKRLITILDNKKMNNYTHSQLSKSWYVRDKKEDLEQLKKNLVNYFQNITKAKSSEILWTAPKDYYKALKGKGYSIVKIVTRKDRERIEKDICKNNPNITDKKKIRTLVDKNADAEKKSCKCFIPCNARATNIYGDRSVLAYCINLYPNPFIKRYFSNKNMVDKTNIVVDDDSFALSTLLQWIWRSRIRNGRPITIYIPSKRMRELLQNWLNS
jgi:hypothetical protein